MYFKDEEHWTTYGSVVSCNKEDAHYADISEYELLEEQNAALAAQVEVLREQLQTAHDCITCADETGYVQDVGFVDLEQVALGIRHALAATPQQHLAEIRAEAVREAFDSIFGKFDFGQYNAKLGLLDDIESLFNQYADSIRKGEVK